MHAIGQDMDPAVVAAIDARLDGVARDHGVAIPWAVESGSRAWGFPSPDSDYDCRFFFVRPASAYAAPWRPRDVVETPLDPVLDVNGWDLVKAVRLAVVGNATVAEWLRSPLVYRGAPSFRDELEALFRSVADPSAIVRHYLHVGRNQWRRADADSGEPVRLKRVFYALRPALTLHWMAAHGPARVVDAPMAVDRLVAQAPPPAAVAEELAALIALKGRTRELGEAPVPPAIRGFVAARFAEAGRLLEAVPPPDRAAGRGEATRRFRDLLARWAPAAMPGG